MVPPAPTLLQQWWLPTAALLQQWWLPKSMVDVVHLLHINGNKPNNHPLCHSCGATVRLFLQHKFATRRSSKLTILRASLAKFTSTCHTFQSPESPKHTLAHTKGSLQPDGLPLHIWRVLMLVSRTQHSPSSLSTVLDTEWFIKPHITDYNTPSNGNIYFQVWQSLFEYLNMITSSLLFQESTHVRVTSTLCSTLETTSYFSMSLSLLILRIQVALYLYLWGMHELRPLSKWVRTIFTCLPYFLGYG